jgi:hypothetical protein
MLGLHETYSDGNPANKGGDCRNKKCDDGRIGNIKVGQRVYIQSVQVHSKFQVRCFLVLKRTVQPEETRGTEKAAQDE